MKQQNKKLQVLCRVSNENLSMICVQKYLVSRNLPVHRISQNNLKTCKFDIKNLIRQKRPKRAKFQSAFLKK